MEDERKKEELIEEITKKLERINSVEEMQEVQKLTNKLNGISDC